MPAASEASALALASLRPVPQPASSRRRPASGGDKRTTSRSSSALTTVSGP
jgi:hypothetical protein